MHIHSKSAYAPFWAKNIMLDWWMDGWVGESKSQVKDCCLQQSKKFLLQNGPRLFVLKETSLRCILINVTCKWQSSVASCLTWTPRARVEPSLWRRRQLIGWSIRTSRPTKQGQLRKNSNDQQGRISWRLKAGGNPFCTLHHKFTHEKASQIYGEECKCYRTKLLALMISISDKHVFFVCQESGPKQRGHFFVFSPN